MFKVILLLIIFTFSAFSKERVTGRSLAIRMTTKEIQKELGVSTTKEIQEIYNNRLKKYKIGSAERNRLLLYRDSLNLKDSAPKRINIYHQDTASKKWERFKNRLYRGFNLKTVIELFSFLLVFIAVSKKVQTKPRSNIRKKKYSFTADLFSNEDFLEKMNHLHKRDLLTFKNKILKITTELNFLFNDHDHLDVDFGFHHSRFFLILDLQVSNSNDLRTRLDEFHQAFIGHRNFNGFRVEQITNTKSNQILMVSLEIFPQNKGLNDSF